MESTLGTTFSNLSNYNLLRQGAEARLFTGEFFGRPAIIKERFSKKYRHPVLDDRLTKDRMRGEARSLLRCKMVGVRTPTIFLSDLDRGILVMEYLNHAPTCRDFLKSIWPDMEETTIRSQLVELAAEIGRNVALLHSNNIIHGDLTTSNILVESREPFKLCLIDFGLGSSDGSAEAKGVDLYVLERALISSHPNSEFMFETILSSYQSSLKKTKDVDEVLKKFEEVRLRGRKRTMVG